MLQAILLRTAIGTVSGIAAAYVMEQFQKWIQKNGDQESSKPEQDSETQASENSSADERPATVRAANRISKLVLHRKLKKREEPWAGELVHLGMGAFTGAVYSVVARRFPIIRAAGGLLYGATVFLAADEVAVPSAGLSKKPTQYPPSTHLYALSSHLVYGLSLHFSEKALRKLLRA